MEFALKTTEIQIILFTVKQFIYRLLYLHFFHSIRNGKTPIFPTFEAPIKQNQLR